MSELHRKDARQLNTAKFLNTNIDEETGMVIYRSFILSNFNYSPLVWHFCGVLNTKQMEKVQKRALRFVYNDFTSTYEELLAKGNHSTLYITRLRYMNSLNPTYLQDMVTTINIEYTLRNPKPVQQPK